MKKFIQVALFISILILQGTCYGSTKRTLTTEEVKTRFQDVSKKVALRYCESQHQQAFNPFSKQRGVIIGEKNVINCCNELALLLEASAVQDDNQYEQARILDLGWHICLLYKRAPEKSRTMWETERPEQWTKVTEKLLPSRDSILTSRSTHPYIQFAQLTNFGQDKSKVKEIENLLKKHPEFLEGYYYLVTMNNQPDNWLDKWHTRYFQEAKKQNAWDHLYYLSLIEPSRHRDKAPPEGFDYLQASHYLFKMKNPDSDWNLDGCL